MKKWCVIIICIVFCCTSCSSREMDNLQQTMKYHHYQTTYDSSEIVDVWEAVKKSEYFLEAQTSEVINEEYMISHAYKQYYLSSIDFQNISEQSLNKLNENTSEYRWIIPMDDGSFFEVCLQDQLWNVVRYSKPTQVSLTSVNISSQIVQWDEFDENILLSEKYNSQAGAECNPFLICFSVPQYYTTFVYYSTKDHSCIVPYSARPDWTGLKNGYPYSVEETKNTLLATFK